MREFGVLSSFETPGLATSFFLYTSTFHGLMFPPSQSNVELKGANEYNKKIKCNPKLKKIISYKTVFTNYNS